MFVQIRVGGDPVFVEIRVGGDPVFVEIPCLWLFAGLAFRVV